MTHIIFAVVALVFALALFCCFEVSGRYSEHEEEEEKNE